MNVQYINPFIESVVDFFGTMLACQVQRGDVSLSNGNKEPLHLMALIGLSGPVRGTVALSLPRVTVAAITSRLLGEEMPEDSEEVNDAVAEVVNIIAGGAKARLGNDGQPIDLGLPTVVVGDDYRVKYPSDAIWLDVPFSTELGRFNLRVTFEHEPGS